MKAKYPLFSIIEFNLQVHVVDDVFCPRVDEEILQILMRNLRMDF